MYVVIDSINIENDETASFLNDTECVPYTDKFYGMFKYQNQYGQIQPAFCT